MPLSLKLNWNIILIKVMFHLSFKLRGISCHFVQQILLFSFEFLYKEFDFDFFTKDAYNFIMNT